MGAPDERSSMGLLIASNSQTHSQLANASERSRGLPSPGVPIRWQCKLSSEQTKAISHRRPLRERRTEDEQALQSWPHDAARRHARQVVSAPVFAGERVAIWAARTAYHVPLLPVAGLAGRSLPRAIVGHRSFDGEYAAIMVGDDQKKWLGLRHRAS